MAAPTAEIDADIWERITALADGRLVIPHYIERQTRGAALPTEAPRPMWSGPPISFEEALAKTAPMSAAKKAAARAEKVAQAKRHDDWLKAQRRVNREAARRTAKQQPANGEDKG